MHELYRHFKGGIYQVIEEAKDSNDPNKIFVVYRHLGLNGRDVWIREKKEFYGKIPSGELRFEKISYQDALDAGVWRFDIMGGPWHEEHL